VIDRETARLSPHPSTSETPMDIEQELIERWKQGMKGYRKEGEPFVGNPLEELRVEILDGINYVREAQRQDMIELQHEEHIEHWLIFLLGYTEAALEKWRARERLRACIDSPVGSGNTRESECIPANGEGHHPGDPDCTCFEKDKS